jgi:hypothetical protein
MLILNTPFRFRIGGDLPVALSYCAYCLSKMTA